MAYYKKTENGKVVAKVCAASVPDGEGWEEIKNPESVILKDPNGPKGDAPLILSNQELTDRLIALEEAIKDKKNNCGN